MKKRILWVDEGWPEMIRIARACANVHIRSRRGGFSLVELLVCIGIIMILAALLLAALIKTRDDAQDVAATEAIRQEAIAQLAGPDGHVSHASDDREHLRAAYRETLDTGKDEVLVTRIPYGVTAEAQFVAYWHTVINPDASGPLEFEYDGLIVKDASGTTFKLKPHTFWQETQYDRGAYPYMWEYLSTNMADMNSTSRSIRVLYTDGEVKNVRYPGEFPACETVAELSYRFLHP